MVPAAELGQALTVLLSPLDQEACVWRQEVTRAMRALMEADGATLFMFQGAAPSVYVDRVAPATIKEYFTKFAPLDFGMARRDALKLALWNRRMLWDNDSLIRSTYFNEFALPHDLHDSLGISLDLEPGCSHMRLVMLYGRAPLPPERAAELLARAATVVPALRTGFAFHLRFEQWLLQIPRLMDKVGQRLALFNPTGRELYRNAMMRRTLAQDSAAGRIEAALSAVALGTASCVHLPGARAALPLRNGADPSRREVRTATARYQLRGCIMGLDAGPLKSAVLVSMDRLHDEAPSADSLRERFGFTTRESHVASLLIQRLTNAEIASALGISPHTARHHTESVLVKAGVNSRRSLCRILNGES
jgi:DNA-binding CsgD family transcriptional regulator